MLFDFFKVNLMSLYDKIKNLTTGEKIKITLFDGDIESGSYKGFSPAEDDILNIEKIYIEFFDGYCYFFEEGEIQSIEKAEI